MKKLFRILELVFSVLRKKNNTINASKKIQNESQSLYPFRGFISEEELRNEIAKVSWESCAPAHFITKFNMKHNCAPVVIQNGNQISFDFGYKKPVVNFEIK